MRLGIFNNIQAKQQIYSHKMLDFGNKSYLF